VKRILVVEDDRSIGDLLRATLAAEGFAVEVARDGKAGLDAFARFGPDLVILDRMLPEIDGLDVLRQIRRSAPTPVIFLTVKDDETDKVVGLEMGADDYVTKPFGVRELVARVRTLLRRRESGGERRRKLVFGDLSIDLDERQVVRDRQPVEMTRTEFDLLALLASHPGIVLTREKLLDGVWGYSFEGYQRTVDTHITRLRKKIETDPRRPALIRTVWGVGYRFRGARPED
jgi:DNA-binding response OmpR family regulator